MVQPVDESGSAASAASRADGSARSKSSRRSAASDSGVCIFSSDGRRFAVDTSIVGEVVNVDKILPVPKSSPAILGVMNLRGTPVAVVDLMPLLGQGAPHRLSAKEHTCLVLRVTTIICALRIDRLHSVVPPGRGERVVGEGGHEHPVALGYFELEGQETVIFLGAQELLEEVKRLSFSNSDRREAV